MSKTKTLIGMITLTCALLASAAPASAWFEATTAGATTGPVVSFPATTTLTAVNGVSTAQIVCASTAASKAVAFWTIQSSEETVTETEQRQPPTKLGPHQAVTIRKWGSCKATIGGTSLAAEVSECRIQAAQPTKSTAEQEIFGSIQTNCVVKIPAAACTITWPQLSLNHLIKWIRAAAAGVGRIILRWLMRLLHYNASAGCVGISGEHEEGSFITGTEGKEGFELEGLKLV